MISLILHMMENVALKNLFLKIANMSISASWIVIVVLLLRLVLKKAPKWVNVLLWGIVAIRLICPFSFESALSLIPSAETIPMNIEMDATPAIDSGVTAVNSVVNPMISASFTPHPGASANPLQIWIPLVAVIWFFGMVLMLLYTAISYWRLRRKVDTAVFYKGNIFQSENVCSPFVLGIMKPRIYLPFAINEQDLDHVIAHEQAHIRRKDHWWKPLGFLLLMIHWFNPLMWLAYLLLCRDIELACDEKVIKELDNEQRADYTQALVACSVNRRIVAACPLAFGEVGVKERVKSVMNYKKPAFWIIILAIITCVIVAVCFLTNPAAEREFPINGSNVSTLDTERVVEMIAKAEKLDDGSQLCINEDNFDLMFTSDFEWANDGAIRFFYLKDQKTYSAQLRMFHDDNKYFITDSVEWVEQEQFFKLFHYLDALKYMPQEEIRKLSPDADGFSVYMRNDGVPGDYDRVLKYSQNGVEDIDGWYIHLEVQPLHEVEGGAYNGSRDELIHLFYGHQDLVMLENNTVTKWFDYTEDSSQMSYENELKIQLDEFPDITFKYTPYEIIATTSWDDSELEGHTILVSGMPVWNAYFADLTGDGMPELCSSLSMGSGMIDNRVIIFDYANGVSYKLEDRGSYDYYLRMDDANGCLYVDKKEYRSDNLVFSGKLVFKDGCIQLEGVSAEPTTILQAKLLEINNGYFLVEPVEGSWELYSADKIEIPMKNMSPSPEPQVGDILQIEYDGQIEETYPARINNPYSIRVVKEAETVNSDMLDVFKNSISGDETTIVTDYVYADDEAYGLDGIVQYADETGSPWKLAFIRDGVVHPVSQDWGTDYIIASELTYLGNGAVQVYVESTKDGVFYECIIRFSHDAESGNINFKSESKEVEIPDDTMELMIDPVAPVSVVNLITGEERIITANADVRTIQLLTSSEWWAEGNPACDNDFKIAINGESYWYHSDCGTLNDIYNDKCISLDESKREEINTIFGVTNDLEFDKFYLTIGAEGVKSIEVTMPNSSGGCENADGSLFKKGDRVWVECLDGYKDLRGVSITALGENGEIIWTASIPDSEENKGFTHLTQDGWTITNIE